MFGDPGEESVFDRLGGGCSGQVRLEPLNTRNITK